MINKNAVFLVLILAVFLSAGCAAKMQMNVDGVPMPNTTFTAKNPATDIRVEAYMARMMEREDGNEGNKEVYPADYLDLGRGNLYQLDPDTVAVSGKVRVINPQNRKYFIKVIYKVDYSGKKFPYVTSHVLYEGSAREKVFNINRNVEDSRPEVECRIVVEEGEVPEFRKGKEPPMFDIRLAYKVAE